jgi:site-specific DNA-adenine methylase
MKQHFFLPYFGNKREEVEHIYELIRGDIHDKEYIIEPYCGSCAMSFYISLQHPGKYKYILNDNNKFLIQLMKTAQNEDELKSLVEDLKEIQKSIKTKDEYQAFCDKGKTFMGWLLGSSWYNIRPYLYPTGNRTPVNYNNFLNKKDFINFLKTEDIEFSSRDAIDIINEYKDNEKALILLDPPYLSVTNDFYVDSNTNIYEWLFNNDIHSFKSSFYLVLENIWIIQLLFKDYNSFIYD